MKNYFFTPLFLTVIILVFLNTYNVRNNVSIKDKRVPENDTSGLSDGHFLNGSWAYRSLLNDTDWKLPFDQLRFASAVMDLKTFGKDSISGILYWAKNPTQGLMIAGKYYYQGTTICYSLVGNGTAALGTPGWQYDYKGYIAPQWSNGVKQADVLVGGTIRVKPHNGAPAGQVATTYMVRRKN
jgi:hypothetical protein